MKEGKPCKSRGIKMTIRKYYQQLYANNFDNLSETGRFLETHRSPRLTQEETESLHSSMSMNQIHKGNPGQLN